MMKDKSVIACVDDERAVLSALQRALGRGPYEVITTQDPREALEWVETRGIGVIVTDERMPVMTGSELVCAVEERAPGTKRVLLTGYPDHVEREARARVHRLITKPWDDAGLRSVIAELLAEAPVEDAGDLRQRLFRVAYMILRDRWVAEDVAQQTMAQAIEHMPEFRHDGNLFAWMYTIAVNLCRAHLKSERVRPAHVDPSVLDRAGGSPDGPAREAMRHEAGERAAAAVAELAPRLREAFVLHYVEGLPYEIVASICGISEVAARQRALRARSALKRRLGPAPFAADSM